jgi:regulator of RNase E activity RraA
MKKSMRSILEELCDFDTALLANTIGYIDRTPAHEWYMGGSIQSVTPTLGPTVGIAITVEADTSTPNNKADAAGYWQQLEQMSKMDVPTVWVVKSVGSRPDHECIIGDGMAKTLCSVGCLGLVTDGGVRDVKGLLTTGFAAYCKGTTIHHTALRFRRMNKPVKIGGITVKTGDVIHANDEGVIKLPAGCVDKLAEAAIRMRAFEHEAHLGLRRKDLSVEQKKKWVGDAIAKYGFADCVTVKK